MILEGIILHHCCKDIGESARLKKKSPLMLKLVTVLLWFAVQITAFVVAFGILILLDDHNLQPAQWVLAGSVVYGLSFLPAYGVIILVRAYLEGLDDLAGYSEI